MVQKRNTTTQSQAQPTGKKRKNKPAEEYDSPWKHILERFFPEFLLLFFPHVYADIDWRRPPEFLNAELHKIMPKSEVGKHHVDKLVKVYLKDGEEVWVLIHIEVQSQKESNFEYRVYIYNYRSHDRYKRPVMSLAILGDNDPDWQPNSYQQTLWGCTINFTFPTVKLLDYAEKWQELEQSTNPFALVVMAHLKAQATHRQPQDRLQAKKLLIRSLYERGYSREQVEEIFRFIDWVLRLPDDLDKQIDTFLLEQEETIKMKYVTGFERRAAARAHEKGLEEGKEIAQRETILLILRHRFATMTSASEEADGSLDEATVTAVTQQINQLKELALLTQAINRALTTPSIEAFQRYLAEMIVATTPATQAATAPTATIEKQSKRKRKPAVQP